MVLLILIYCHYHRFFFFFFFLGGGGGGERGFGVLSVFAIISQGKRGLVALLKLPSVCHVGWYSVSLLRGAIGLSTPCDHGIFWSYSLIFLPSGIIVKKRCVLMSTINVDLNHLMFI